jgi:hypothetical protein
MSIEMHPAPLSPSARPPRHALGLPAGSVRAMLALCVLGLLALIVFTGREDKEGVETLYFYLCGMLFLIVAHYFTARSRMASEPAYTRQPLGLPRGSVRLLLIAGMAAIVAWLWQHDRKVFEQAPQSLSPGLLLLIPCGFLLGWFVSRLVYLAFGKTEPFWYQDVQAWVAILAVGMLLIDLVFQIFINPSLAPELRRNLSFLEGALTAAISFYFGARS